MEEVSEAIKARLGSPLFGYFLLSLIAFNWDSFFYLIVQENDVIGRIQYFKNNTDITRLLVLPLLTSVLFVLIYPWVAFLIARFTSKPFELKETLQARAEHKILSERRKLEEVSAKLLASAESELIERAKRDQELDALENEDVKNKLKAELEQLRAERSLKSNSSDSISEHKQLMEISGMYRNRAANTSNYQDRDKLIEQAQEIEQRALELLLAPK